MYIAEGSSYTYGLKTLSQIDSITGMVDGETVYCTDHNRILTYGDEWMCSDFVMMKNRSGGALSRWDIVVVESGGTSTEISCDTTVSSADGSVVGVVVFGGASDGDNTAIAIKGNWRVNVDEAISLGEPLTTSTTAGEAQGNAGSYYGGVFGWATESSVGAGTVDCLITSRKEIY